MTRPAGITEAVLIARATEFIKTRNVSNRINCHCFLIRRDLEEIGVPQEGDKVRFSFLISQVESIRECMNNDQIVEDECLVWFKSGSNYIIDKSYDEMYSLVFGENN